MRVFCLCNIKGGVTKSTSTVNLGYGLAQAGYKVLILNMDPQCNTTYTLTGRLDEETEGTLYEVLIPTKDAKTLDQVVETTGHKNLFLAPGSIWLSSADIELVNRTNREKVLAKALRGLQGYDFVLIDPHPNLWRPQRGDLTHQLFVHDGTETSSKWSVYESDYRSTQCSQMWLLWLALASESVRGEYIPPYSYERNSPSQHYHSNWLFGSCLLASLLAREVLDSSEQCRCYHGQNDARNLLADGDELGPFGVLARASVAS